MLSGVATLVIPLTCCYMLVSTSVQSISHVIIEYVKETASERGSIHRCVTIDLLKAWP